MCVGVVGLHTATPNRIYFFFYFPMTMPEHRPQRQIAWLARFAIMFISKCRGEYGVIGHIMPPRFFSLSPPFVFWLLLLGLVHTENAKDPLLAHPYCR